MSNITVAHPTEYRIHYTDDAPSDLSDFADTTWDDYTGMVDALEELGYIVGHSGDLADGGDRTLIWTTPAEAENDDGAHAVAEIRAE